MLVWRLISFPQMCFVSVFWYVVSLEVFILFGLYVYNQNYIICLKNYFATLVSLIIFYSWSILEKNYCSCTALSHHLYLSWARFRPSHLKWIYFAITWRFHSQIYRVHCIFRYSTAQAPPCIVSDLNHLNSGGRLLGGCNLFLSCSSLPI
jgi:hypothetical protein